MRVRQISWLWVIVLLGGSTGIAAQPSAAPIGRYVVDARGSFARFKADAAISESIAVDVENLPTRGLGGTVGAHWYPIHLRRIAFGIGGELLFARGSRTLDATDSTPEGPLVTTRLSAISPQISLNFGRGEGWSYLSGGTGWARVTTENAAAATNAAAPRTRSINYGGGARWFTSPRIAFTFDVRFFAVSPRISTPTVSGYPRTRTMVISAGMSLR